MRIARGQRSTTRRRRGQLAKCSGHNAHRLARSSTRSLRRSRPQISISLRVLRSHHCAAHFRGKLQSRDHVRYRDPRDHQHDPLTHRVPHALRFLMPRRSLHPSGGALFSFRSSPGSRSPHLVRIHISALSIALEASRGVSWPHFDEQPLAVRK